MPWWIRTETLSCDPVAQEVADLQATWKLRTPNEWEPLTHWADLLVWRNHCYHLMITSHYASPANQEAMTQNGFTDKAWSVNRLASIARKHGAYASCVDIINSLYGFDTMQVQEAFVKIREQAKAQMADPTQIPHAFTLLNDSNLSYFPAHQQAELLRLKGLCLERIGHDDDANDAFALALSLHDRLPEAWLSWGSFCESAGVRQGKPQEQYLEQAVSCYLTAASHGTQAARAMLVRALALLSGEDVNGAVLKAFDAHGGSVPTVAWVPLTPQIVAGLQHHEAPIMRALCKRLVVAHPQHTYLHLRALLLGLRSVVNKPEIEGLLGKYINNSNGVADLVTAFEEGKKIMHWLRQDNTHEVTLLEVIIHEMTHSLAPRPEERLFAVVQTLLQRCHRVRFRDDSDVPAAIQADFVGVIRACFHREGSSSSLARYEQAFNRDLSPNSPSAPKTLGELIMRLKAWRHFLEQTVEAICPGKLLIEEEAPKLLELCYVGLEMPGHVPSGGQGDASGVYVERFGGDVDVVRRGGNSFRRVQIWGTDGVVRHLLLQTFATSNAAAGDDRIVQLLHVLNKQLEHLPQARRRRLSFLAPVSVPLHHNMRLIEDCPSMSMYGDPYTIYCERNGQDPDLAITQFKRICLAKSGEIANFDPPMRPFVSFKQIIGAISDNIFAQFIYKTIPSPTMLVSHSLLLPRPTPSMSRHLSISRRRRRLRSVSG